MESSEINSFERVLVFTTVSKLNDNKLNRISDQ